ncbi:MAG: carboxylating nicotinate-nucleotide diphosphorylase [Acidobacteriota bacterium]
MFRLHPETIKRVVSQALAEDCGECDLTTEAIVRLNQPASGEFLAKEALVLAGWEVAAWAFQLRSSECVLESSYVDGQAVAKGEAIGRVRGPASALLSAERVALNFLQRLSGIATLTRQYVDAVSGTAAVIVDTRKTTPGLRNLEKYAVRVGGGRNHRFGLFDGVLIKENHIAVAGGIDQAIASVRRSVDHLKKIEVEVTSLHELQQALDAGADAVLLDNMKPDEVREAVRLAAGRAVLEVSGGIQLETVREYALTGVQIISVGALTHSPRAMDISLELQR